MTTKPKTMKAYLIDPATHTIKEVEHNGDYKQIYTLIDADCFDVARINDKGDGIFVDDEGLLNDKGHTVGFFRVGNDQGAHILAGKGLVLGCNAAGDSISPRITLEALRSMVDFVQPIRMAGRLMFVGDNGVYPAPEY